nr:hypothetical protein CFP56_50698 [Quercus suber]
MVNNFVTVECQVQVFQRKSYVIVVVSVKPRLLSREEEAELARSNKKVKDIHHADFNNESRKGSPSPDSHNAEAFFGGSFKEKLVGDIPGAYVKAFEFENLMDEDVESDCENEEVANRNRVGRVNVKLSKETKRRIRGPWSRAIIVKLVGRSVGFTYLKSKLSQLWRPSARMDFVDLSYGFFLVRFFSKEDLDSILMKGPWFIGDHFLSIRPWEPCFKPSTTNVALIAVWIRLYELPIELYDIEVLKQIRESIGKVLRINSHTALEARGKYARICIQIDVNEPLVNTICLGRFKQVVMYKGIHSLYFSCGRLGHKVNGCPYTIRKEKELSIPSVEAQSLCFDKPRGLHVDQSSSSTHPMVDVGESSEVDDQYGEWMVVRKRTYGRTGTMPGVNTDSTRKSTWQTAPHLPPRNPDWVSTPFSGPVGSQSVPRKERGYPRKGHEKWATRFNGPVGGSNPGLTSYNMGFGKSIDTNLAQSSGFSPSPSRQATKKLASSVKGKKAIARGSLLKASSNVAVNPLSNSFAANITSLSSNRVSPTRKKCRSSKPIFEFTVSSLTGQELQGGQGSGHLVDPAKADALTNQGNGDESVDDRSNPCFRKGSDREGVGAADNAPPINTKSAINNTKFAINKPRSTINLPSTAPNPPSRSPVRVNLI